MKNKKLKIIFILLLLFIINNFCYSEVVAEKKNFLWEVKSQKSTVYLLGSIHFAKKSLYPLDKAIESAFESSSYLAVEIDINNINPFEMINIATYSDTNTLEKNVTKEVFAIFQREFERLKMPKESYNKFKPWFALMTLMSLELMNNGYEAESGIDAYFLKKAKNSGKKILELETLQSQINLFENALKEFNASFVEYSLKDFNMINDQIDKMFEFWKNGDFEAMNEFIEVEIKKYDGYESIQNALIDDRNIKMTEKIEEYLKTEGTYFVVVGSAHLTGNMGIVNLLYKTGKYSIIQK